MVLIMKKYKAKSFLLLCLSTVLLLSGCGASSAKPEQISSEKSGETETIDLSSAGITYELYFNEDNVEDVVAISPDGSFGFRYPDNNHQSTPDSSYDYCGEGQLYDYSLHDGYIEMKIKSVKTDYYRYFQGSDELLEENVKVDNPHFEEGDEIIIYLAESKTSVIPQSLLERDEEYQYYSSLDLTPEERSIYLDTFSRYRFYNKTKDIYITEVMDYGDE